MAKKISELTSATTLTGTETLPVVQGGVTKSVAVNDLMVYGTWNPTIYGGTTAGTYTYDSTGKTCSYTKMGRLVTLFADIGFTAASGGSGFLTIGNLPYVISNDATFDRRAAGGECSFTNFDLTNANAKNVSIFAPNTTTLGVLESIDNGSWTTTDIAAIATNTQLRFTMMYLTDA